MNPAFRQIGNAVPPLMAKALATMIARALGTRTTTAEESLDEPVRAAAAV
jgi:DNA (cytosine-5)-methyltransferase 1